MYRRPVVSRLPGLLRRAALLVPLLAAFALAPSVAYAAGPDALGPPLAACLADGFSVQGLFDQLTTTHLIQVGIIGGCIALYIMFRSKSP
jgi:hypothetical protein